MSATNLLILQIVFILCNIAGIIGAIYAYKDETMPTIFSIPIGYVFGLIISASIAILIFGMLIIGKALFL